MKKAVLLTFLLYISMYGYSQSICFYLTDNETYVAPDGENITFYKNGKVAINGKVDAYYSFVHSDCTIELYYKKKHINSLTHSIGLGNKKYDCDCLVDNRKIIYTHLQRKK